MKNENLPDKMFQSLRINDFKNKAQSYFLKMKTPQILMWGVFCFALILRLLFYWKFPHLETPDVASYLKCGEELFNQGQIKDGRAMPLFPIITHLAGSGIRLLGILLSSASAVIVSLISLRIFRDYRVSYLSGFIFSFYPYFIYFSVVPITETFFIFFFLLGWLFLVQEKVALLSIAWTLSILIRPSLDYFAPLALFLCVWMLRKNVRSAFKALGIYGLTYCLLMMPWWYHNYKKYDRFVRLSTGLGVALYAGNVNLSNEGWFQNPDGENLSFPPEIQSMSELDADKYLIQKTVEFVVAKPEVFLRSMAIKFFRFWKPFPDPSNYGKSWVLLLVAILSSGFLMLGAFWSLWKFQAWPLPFWICTVGLVAYFTLLHTLTIANIRYRLPIDALLSIAAAHGWILIGKYLMEKFKAKF